MIYSRRLIKMPPNVALNKSGQTVLSVVEKSESVSSQPVVSKNIETSLAKLLGDFPIHLVDRFTGKLGDIMQDSVFCAISFETSVRCLSRFYPENNK